MPYLGPRPQSRQRGEQRLLDDVIGTVRAQPAGERKQLALVARHDRGERTIIATRRQLGQLLIAQRRELDGSEGSSHDQHDAGWRETFPTPA
jgi:hypothetical protein